MTERQLRAIVERRQCVFFWGRRHYITPRLCNTVFGDGASLVYWATLDHRPNYYVVRVDSSWRIEANDDEGADDIREHIEEIEDALVAQFSYNTDDDTPDRPISRRYPRGFPCIPREMSGCHWGRIPHGEIPWPTKKPSTPARGA
jgi:hypothetical protein